MRARRQPLAALAALALLVAACGRLPESASDIPTPSDERDISFTIPNNVQKVVRSSPSPSPSPSASPSS